MAAAAALFVSVSERLEAIDFPLKGEAASPGKVESLFQPSFRDQPANPPLALSPRLCEEYLATALVASRQAIEARQAYFDAGDKFASLTLSIAADSSAEALLSAEAEAMKLRQKISTATVQAEKDNITAIAANYDEVSAFRAGVEPNSAGAAGDANRSKWLSYISRSVNGGFNTMAAFWGNATQVDAAPGGGQQPFSMPPNTAVVDLESELARRAVVASYRVQHARVGLEQQALATAKVSAAGKQSAAEAAEAFDGATATLAQNRATAASGLLQAKRDLTRTLSLLDFQGQMELHRRRAQDLLQEASERATAALKGLRDVYGLTIPDLPAFTIETAESLLFWCRDVGRILIGLDSAVIKQIATFSLRSVAGANWRNKISQGISIDASSLRALGRVVRLRDVTARFVGTERSSVVVNLATPSQAHDRDVASTDRGITQDLAELQLVASSVADLDLVSRRTAARVVHNLCPSGTWTIRAAGVGSSIEDLLLDLEISYLRG